MRNVLKVVAVLSVLSVPALADQVAGVNTSQTSVEVQNLQQKLQQQSPAAEARDGGSANQDAARRANDLIQQGAFDQAGGYLELLRRRIQ